MDNTTQWSISWSIALCPPQEMLPPESLFCPVSCDDAASANGEHLFGFPPFQACSDSMSSERDMADTRHNDNLYTDCATVFAVEEFVPFI